MNFSIVKESMAQFLNDCPDNYVQPEDAMEEQYIGMKIYDDPVFAVGSAHDPMFRTLSMSGVVGQGFIHPEQWLVNAERVVSIFFPFTEKVRRSNAVDFKSPSDEWLHARVEGQMMQIKFAIKLCEILRAEGYDVVVPTADSRFTASESEFTSNWSERHVGYVCGLGTFGMSKGLITEKGIAGRITSIITSAPIEITDRKYNSTYEYCVRCGACAAHCPVCAIDKTAELHKAKSHVICSGFLSQIMQREPRGKSRRMRYGCGKCQVHVPCESCIPVKKR